MAHNLNSLKIIVHGHNQTALSDLWNSKSWLFPTFTACPTLASKSPREASISSVLHTNLPISGSGVIGGHPVGIPGFVQKSLCNSPQRSTEAVFSVIDDAPFDDHFPVVLCVGINYSQFKGPKGGVSHAGKTYLHTKTGMRANVASAFNKAGKGIPAEYHLIASNFFPWITDQAWTSTCTNRGAEAMLFHCCGYSNPVAVIGSLMNQIQPEWVLLHGVNSCAPILGIQALAYASLNNTTALVCDNLGWHRTMNAIVLP